MTLTDEAVRAVFAVCELPEAADRTDEDVLVVESIGVSVLSRSALEENRETVSALLSELPEEFMESGGGGWSFLNACNDKDGHQWTGLHASMLQLFHLGIGIERVKATLPREMWSMLPGGMPYYVIKDVVPYTAPA